MHFHLSKNLKISENKYWFSLMCLLWTFYYNRESRLRTAAFIMEDLKCCDCWCSSLLNLGSDDFFVGSFLLTLPHSRSSKFNSLPRRSQLVSDWLKFIGAWVKTLRRLLFRISIMVGGGGVKSVGGGQLTEKILFVFCPKKLHDYSEQYFRFFMSAGFCCIKYWFLNLLSSPYMRYRKLFLLWSLIMKISIHVG